MKNSAPTNLFSLKSKNIIITGALGLLGNNFTHTLVQQGATVHIIDVLKAADAKKRIDNSFSNEQKKHIKYYYGDITDKKRLNVIKKSIVRSSKKIDVLINNASFTHKVERKEEVIKADNRFETFPLDRWEEEMRVNINGTMLCSQVFGSSMRSGASIINIASIYAVAAPDQRIYPKGYIQPATYGVTKSGIIALTRYLASYWGHKNIRVNCLVLGGVFAGQDKKFLDNYNKKTMLGRMAQPNDYNGIITYLASDSSQYATGAIFTIDGGFTAW